MARRYNRNAILKCALRILRANQVSPLQNWYPIIYIHNGMINSVRYAELGEARLAPKRDILLFYNPIRLRCAIGSNQT